MITWHPPLSWHNHEPSLVCIPPDDDNNDDDFDDVCIADDNKSDLIIPTLIILPITFLIVRIIVLNKFPFIWFLVPRPTVGHPPLQSPLIESLFGKTTIIIIFHSRALYHRCMYVCGTPENKHQRGKHLGRKHFQRLVWFDIHIVSYFHRWLDIINWVKTWAPRVCRFQSRYSRP